MLLALRHPRLWLVSGWTLIICAFIASLVPAHDPLADRRGRQSQFGGGGGDRPALAHDCDRGCHHLVLRGQAARMIVAHAAACDVDLIVMGTHGRTGLSHLLLGSVTERVLRTAACPVLTIRLRGEPKPSATEPALAYVRL